MLVVKPAANVYFGESELLVSAKHLLGTAGISRRIGGIVTYVHILFEEHQIVVANGSFSESFFPEPTALSSLEDATRQEVIGLFRELSLRIRSKLHHTARMCLNRREARVLQHLAA
jgi:hypothetical protein